MKTIGFFNNKGGVGKTTLVYHIAWMFSELGIPVLAVDLDPQGNLSSMFLDDGILETLWPEKGPHKSIFASITPILDGLGDICEPHIERINDNLHLVAGDLGLSLFEDKLSENWPKCLDKDKAAFRAIPAFHRIMNLAAEKTGANIVLIDIGPNLGAINRAALIATDHVVIPLSPGLFSLIGLKNLGPTIENWRMGWTKRLEEKPGDLDIPMPSGSMSPAGYVIMQHVERKSRPVRAYQRWVKQIPSTYRKYINHNDSSLVPSEDDDQNQIGLIKHYQSLMPLAEVAKKPIFLLKPAEGAIGAHAQGVHRCYMDFKRLAENILERTK